MAYCDFKKSIQQSFQRELTFSLGKTSFSIPRLSRTLAILFEFHRLGCCPGNKYCRCGCLDNKYCLGGCLGNKYCLNTFWNICMLLKKKQAYNYYIELKQDGRVKHKELDYHIRY